MNTQDAKELKLRQERRAVVQREINSNKLNIDRSCFQKTPEEKQELKVAKARWKEYCRKTGVKP